MSTPLALQLDGSNWLNRRVVLTIAIVAVVTFIGLTVWARASSPGSGGQVSSGDTPISDASADAVVRAPHSSDGAVTAAASFMSFYGESLASTNSNQVTFFDDLVDSKASPALLKQIGDSIGGTKRAFPKGLKLSSQLTPISYKLLTYSDSGNVTVSIWSNLIVGAGKMPAVVVWTTSDVSLKWGGDHYRVTKWVFRPGPSPRNSAEGSGAKANNAASLIPVNGYSAFRTAPANATGGDAQSNVSVQGSK